MTKSMNSWQRRKRRTDLSSVHRSIMQSSKRTVLSFLDRVFYSSGRAFAFKPAASVAVARRGGCSASFDVLNKYYGICQMPVAGSTYWNMVHGCEPGEVKLDTEGMQTMRNLAKNLAWMMKCFEAGKVAGVPLPETERGNQTNFIR